MKVFSVAVFMLLSLASLAIALPKYDYGYMSDVKQELNEGKRINRV